MQRAGRPSRVGETERRVRGARTFRMRIMATPGKSSRTTEWWCRGDLTAILESPHGRQETTFSRPYVLIGSSESADVRLTGPGMPRRLLYIHADAAGLFAVPLVESSQFQPLPQGWLLDRVPLRLGPYRVTLHWQPEGGISANRRESDLCRRGSLPGLGWEVEVRCDKQALAIIHIRRRLTLIGRRKPCAVQFAHPTVSACHCMVIAEADRLWIADLGSANGTLLNGEAVAAEAWPEYVPLSIGRLSLIPRVRTGAEETAAGSPLPRVESLPVLLKSKDDGDAGPPTRPGGWAEVPGPAEPSEHRFRHAAAHPGFPPPHIALPMDSPQNISVISDTPKAEGTGEDQPRRSGRSGDEVSPAAGTNGSCPAVDEALPVSSRSSGALESADRLDGGAGFVSSANDGITIAGSGAAAWETGVILVVSPVTDAGQWILELPAGFAMQDDRSAALVKDFVLSLLAEEAESEGDARSAPDRGFTWSETIVAGDEWDACRETPSLLAPDDRAECLARREAELSARETFLHEFAKTLEEMSAELLHFQDSLLAEDDRIQQEKKLLEEVRARLGRDREDLCREQEAAMTELRRAREAIHFEERRLAETREEVEAALARQLEEKQALEELREQVERERAAWSEDRLRLQEVRRAADEEWRRLEHEREAWQSRHEAELAAWSEKAAALEAAQAELAEREAQWERRRAELDEAERSLQRREAALADQAETLAKDRETLLARQAEAQAALLSLTQREQALREREQALQAESRRLAEQADSQQRREAHLAAEQHALRARENELDRQHEGWRRRIEEWERRAEAERQERSDQADLRREIAQLKDECARLTHELETRDADSARRREQWLAAESELRADLAKAAEERERLLQDIRRRDDERRQWDQDREAWQEERAALSAEVHRLQAERQQWLQDREDWQGKQADWERQAAAWDAERRRWTAQLAEWESQRRKWEARVAELQARIAERQVDVLPPGEPATAAPPPSTENRKTPPAEDRQTPPPAAAVAPSREAAKEPPDFRRFISKQNKPEPIVIPRLPPRRRGAAPRWLAAAALLAGIAAAATWYSLPRPVMTIATLDFSHAAKLMHARDGTLPAGVEPADLPFSEPFLPDDDAVVRELLAAEDIRDNPVAASLAEPQRQLPGLLFLSRSEDVPFLHLRLKTATPQAAEALLQRWAGVYAAALRRKTEAAARTALERVEAERRDVSTKIAEWTARRKEIEDRLGTSRPVELDARRLQAVHMAAVGEQELGQLTRQMADLTQRRDAAAAAAAEETPLVHTAELNAALETDPEAMELRAKLTALESPQAAGAEPAPAPAAQEQVAELRARWEAVQAKHHERLAWQKKEEFKLTVETLTGELQTLEARRTEVTAEVAERRKTAADCAEAAEVLRRAEQELPELESRAVRLAAKAETLRAAVTDATGTGPAVSLESRSLHEPAEFLHPLLAAAAAALSVFAAWGVAAVLRGRRRPVRYFIEQDALPERPRPQPGKSGWKRASL